MNKVDEIKQMIEKEEEKKQLEKSLNAINEEINTQRKSCSHVSVNLGCYGIYPSTGDEYCCLLCGMGKNHERYFDSKNIVHAEEYLTQYDVKDDTQRNAKFEHIQILALGILKDNPEMSNDELVCELNDLIRESISFKEQSESKLVKTRNRKSKRNH